MFRDFPGGPVVKTLPSNAGVVDFIPGSVFGGGANIPYVWRPKNENIKQKQFKHNNKFNKDLKNGPHKKILKTKTNVHRHLYTQFVDMLFVYSIILINIQQN